MQKILLIVTIFMGIGMLFFVDHWQVVQWRDEKATELDSTIPLCQIRLEKSIELRFNAIKALGALFLMHPDASSKDFAIFASDLLSFNPPIKARHYADSNTRITYVYPSKGNEITVEKPMTLLTDPKRGPFTKKAIQKKFTDLSIGVYDVPVLVSEALEGLGLEQITLNLKDAQGQIFWSSGNLGYSFVKSHNGIITVDSEPAKGAVVGQAALGIEEVTGNVSQSSGVARDMAVNIASVNKTIREMAEKTTRLNACSENLSHLSNGLKRAVKLFKI